MFAPISIVSTVFNFFRTNKNSSVFIGIIIALFAMVIIPNTGKILNAFGWKSSSQVTEAVAAEKQLRVGVINTNATLAQTNQNLQETAADAVIAVSNFYKTKETINQNTVAKIQVKEQKIKKVEADAEEKKAPQEEVSQKVSQVQIDSIWANYCSFNVDNECERASV
jgi:hypothetical protein